MTMPIMIIIYDCVVVIFYEPHPDDMYQYRWSGFSELDSEEDLSKVLGAGEILIKSRENSGLLAQIFTSLEKLQIFKDQGDARNARHLIFLVCSASLMTTCILKLLQYIYEFLVGEDWRGYFASWKETLLCSVFAPAPKSPLGKSGLVGRERGRGNCEPSPKHRFLRHDRKLWNKLEACQNHFNYLGYERQQEIISMLS